MKILLEDDAILVVCKPADCVSEATTAGDGFADLLARYTGGYIGTVHRLDRGVGGVMVYAKTPKSAAILSRAVQERTLQKEYLAIVHGRMESESDTLCDLLFHDKHLNKSFIVERKRAGVKDASLEYRVLDCREHPLHGTLSLLRIKLHTGRTHQIRVQFASRQHPLLGDGKYGARDNRPIALFSAKLAFPHPVTGQPVEAEDMPEWSDFD